MPRFANLRHLRPYVEYMRLEQVEVDDATCYPQVMEPVIAAAKAGHDVVTAIDATVKLLGFNTFMYGCSAALRPDSESKIWTLTTLPLQWVRHYEANDYIEVDPRTQGFFNSPLPVIWDQTEPRTSARIARFLDEAATYGTRSGVAFRIPDIDAFSCIMSFNSNLAVVDNFRRKRWVEQQGELMMFGLYFHAMIMKPLIMKGLAPSSQGTALSARELETLRLVVQGLTHEQIAQRMRITARTVQAHADSIRSKLNASTIGEAVFLATKAGLLATAPSRMSRPPIAPR